MLLFGRQRIEVERPPEGRSDDPAKAGSRSRSRTSRRANRLFVLAPLADLAPDSCRPAGARRSRPPRDRRLEAEGADAARPIAAWDGEGWRPIAGG